MGIMEKKMETTIIIYWGLIGNGKEHGNYHNILDNILGLNKDNGKNMETTIMGFYRDHRDYSVRIWGHSRLGFRTSDSWEGVCRAL